MYAAITEANWEEQFFMFSLPFKFSMPIFETTSPKDEFKKDDVTTFTSEKSKVTISKLTKAFCNSILSATASVLEIVPATQSFMTIVLSIESQIYYTIEISSVNSSVKGK